MKIWILSHYASDLHLLRHYNLAKYLRRESYEPVIFCSNAIHNTNNERVFDNDNLWNEKVIDEIDVPFVYVRTRTYMGNGKQRIFNMLDYYKNVKRVAREYSSIHGSPDIIYASSAHPLTVVAGIKLAKFYGVKCICEIRDLWPESIVAYGIAGPHNLAVLALRKLEKWIYIKSTAIVFTMEGAYDYIVKQGWDKAIPRTKVHYINNGVDLEQFCYNKIHFQIRDDDLMDPNTFKIVYTGSIRKVNNLDLLLDSAKLVKNPKVKFLIWGDGDELPKLKKRVLDEGIFNVVFKGKVDKKYIPYIVSCASVNFAHNKSTYLFMYGISFNKIFDYMAAGRPIFFDFSCRYNPAIEEGCGIEVDNISPSSIAGKIDTISLCPNEEYELYCDNALLAAQKYDFKNLTSKLISIISE